MSIKTLFQKILDGYEDPIPADDLDDEPIYTPKSGNDDELVDVNKNGVKPVRRSAQPKVAPVVADEDTVIVPAPQKPRFKKVTATRLQSGEQIVALAKDGNIVVADTSAMDDAALTKLRCYLAGAVFALDAHITPVDDDTFIFSLEEFDPEAFVNSHS